MWFRVEINRDGSVAACSTTEGSFREGRRVFYVEAESVEEAISSVLSRYAARNAAKNERSKRRYEERRARRQCGQCGLPSEKAKCDACKAARQDTGRRWARTPAEKVQAFLREQELRAIGDARRRESKAARVARTKHLSPEELRAADSHATRIRGLAIKRRARLLVEVITRLDHDGPELFRRWLVQELRELGECPPADPKDYYRPEAAE